MNRKHRQSLVVGLSGLVVVIALGALLALGPASQGSDHNDPPSVVGRTGVDLTDVFAFRSLENAANLVLAMGVNPQWTPGQAFWPEALYELHVDKTGDLLADVVLSVSFGPPLPGGAQEVTLRGLGSPIAGQTTPPGGPVRVFGRDGVKVFAGPRDEPFFNDVPGRMRFLANPFPLVPGNGLRPADERPPRSPAPFDILAIVVELPITLLTGARTPDAGTLRLWAATVLASPEPTLDNPNLVNQWNRWAAERRARNADPDDWEAFRRHLRAIGAPDPGDAPLAFAPEDRMAAPLTPNVVPGPRRNAFNRDVPANDWQQLGADALTSINELREKARSVLPPEDSPGVPPETAASLFLPNVLTVDFSRPVQFPNGRRPADDTADLTLGLLLNRGDVLGGGPGVGDALDANDVPFLDRFPYLAPPH